MNKRTTINDEQQENIEVKKELSGKLTQDSLKGLPLTDFLNLFLSNQTRTRSLFFEERKTKYTSHVVSFVCIFFETRTLGIQKERRKSRKQHEPQDITDKLKERQVQDSKRKTILLCCIND